jgi:hypothetical protein
MLTASFLGCSLDGFLSWAGAVLDAACLVSFLACCLGSITGSVFFGWALGSTFGLGASCFTLAGCWACGFLAAGFLSPPGALAL